MTNQQKSMYKALSYRTISVMLTFGISYTITGSIKAAGAIVSVDAVLKMIVYYGHERLWSKLYKKFKAQKPSSKPMMNAHKQ